MAAAEGFQLEAIVQQAVSAVLMLENDGENEAVISDDEERERLMEFGVSKVK